MTSREIVGLRGVRTEVRFTLAANGVWRQKQRCLRLSPPYIVRLGTSDAQLPYVYGRGTAIAHRTMSVLAAIRCLPELGFGDADHLTC
jgi:hypothetical protein